MVSRYKVIVTEENEIVAFCIDLTHDEEIEIFEANPNYRYSFVEVHQ